jgi:uncharacterized membrane protein YhaH (DUF805 family)
MSDSSHDYSRHTEADLREQIASIDPARFPLRSASLLRELHRRWLLAEEQAGAASASTATAGEGARFDQLDAKSARRFFWPLVGFSFVFSFAVGFAVALLAAIVTGVVAAVSEQTPSDTEATFRVVQIIFGLAVFVPVMKVWVRQLTKRSFGGFGLRVVRPGVTAVAEQANAASAHHA